MKRKILFVFLALLAAFCLAFGFAACGDNPDESNNGGSEQDGNKPDDGQISDDEQPPDDGDNGSRDEKEISYTVTQEEWVSALTSLTTAAYKFCNNETIAPEDVEHLNLTISVWYYALQDEFFGDNEEAGEYTSYKESTGLLQFDYSNKKITYEHNGIRQNSHGEIIDEYEYLYCYSEDGKVYMNDEESGLSLEFWFAYALAYDGFFEVCANDGVVELYEQAVYNEQTQEYELLSSFGFWQLTFNDGKLVKADYHGGEWLIESFEFYDYGTTVLNQ